MIHRKGIVLAGGAGTRLYPLTVATSKQLVPVYDKPMVYYPLSVLMLAGLREILVISSPADLPRFRALLGDGSQIGLNISYAEQPRPEGLPQALIIAKDFLAGAAPVLILGDNLFHGSGLRDTLQRSAARDRGATVFAYHVKDPERYGVIEFDAKLRPISIEEKPRMPRSQYAVTGLYFYDSRAIAIAESLRPSDRGELEIGELNQAYLDAGDLNVELLGRGVAWLDTGTPEALLQASSYVAAVEERQGLKIGALEEVAFRLGYITAQQVEQLAHPYRGSSYGAYLLRLIADSPKSSWIDG